MANLTILLIGDVHRTEFEIACRDLNQFGHIVHARSIDEAASQSADPPCIPDLIVLAQSYPGQFPAAAIARLQSRSPLAPVLALLGPWCEGEMRTGDPYPGVIRVYWHQWRARIACELPRLAAGQSSAWALPRTATEDERLLTTIGPLIRTSPRLIVIATPGYDAFDWLAGACRHRGNATYWFRPSDDARIDGASAALFDSKRFTEGEARELQRVSRLTRGAPVIALIDFPRAEDYQTAVQAGAAAVLSKPLLIDDLYWELDQVVSL